MTPENLAALHPRLFHVTTPGAWHSIAQVGLLPTVALLETSELFRERRAALTTQRRPTEVAVALSSGGSVVLNDNLPLSERALSKCLDDGLTPPDWLRMLNERVFFWANEAGLQRLLGARINRNRAREVLVFDTLGLIRENAGQVELSPINSGATIRRAARRGRRTFTPLLTVSYQDWQRQRGGRDRIVEVVVRGSIRRVEHHLIERREVQGA